MKAAVALVGTRSWEIVSDLSSFLLHDPIGSPILVGLEYVLPEGTAWTLAASYEDDFHKILGTSGILHTIVPGYRPGSPNLLCTPVLRKGVPRWVAGVEALVVSNDSNIPFFLAYKMSPDVSPYASAPTRDLHERIHRRQAVNDRRRDQSAEKFLEKASERFTEIVTDPDRDAGMDNSRKFDELLTKAQKVYDIQARKGTEEEVAEARRKALEAAGGGAVGELVLQMVNNKLLDKSVDLRGDDQETRQIIRRGIQDYRDSVAESKRVQIDEELLRGGFQARDITTVDLSELPLDEIVSFSDAILAAQDDPRLAEWLRNSAMINSKKGRWAEYEKAIKALQESITDKNASPAKLLETRYNVSWKNTGSTRRTPTSSAKSGRRCKRNGSGKRFKPPTPNRTNTKSPRLISSLWRTGRTWTRWPSRSSICWTKSD